MWVAFTLAWPNTAAVRGILTAMGFVCGAMLAVLIGVLAGAEERQMRTLEWQLLLPIAAWKQWTVKVVITTALSMALAFGMPTVMALGEVGFAPTDAISVLVLTIGSLYVATMCDTSIGAMVVAAPVMFGLLAAGLAWFAPVILGGVQGWPLKGAIVLLLALAMQFGYRNYVSAARDLRRLGWQVASMLAILAVVGSIYYAG
jgi:hypothetical protein